MEKNYPFAVHMTNLNNIGKIIVTSNSSNNPVFSMNFNPDVKGVFDKDRSNNYILDNNIEMNNKYDKYIFVSPRVSQSQISIELLKSDIFLYPTDFPETYCIAALEAQISECRFSRD